MFRRALALSGFLAVTLTGPAALAQGFGEAGQFAISAGSLFGVSHDNITLSIDTPNGDFDTELTQTRVDLLSADSASLGFHYVVGPGVTLGAAFAFRSLTGKVKDTPPGGGSTSTDLPTETTIEFGVRVGYAVMFTKHIGLWPGVTAGYRSYKEEDDAFETTLTNPVFGVSVPLVLSPVEHFAITFGPGVGFIAGGNYEDTDKQTNQTVDGTASGYSVGASGGVLGYF